MWNHRLPRKAPVQQYSPLDWSLHWSLRWSMDFFLLFLCPASAHSKQWRRSLRNGLHNQPMMNWYSGDEFPWGLVKKKHFSGQCTKTLRQKPLMPQNGGCVKLVFSLKQTATDLGHFRGLFIRMYVCSMSVDVAHMSVFPCTYHSCSFIICCKINVHIIRGALAWSCFVVRGTGCVFHGGV